MEIAIGACILLHVKISIPSYHLLGKHNKVNTINKTDIHSDKRHLYYKTFTMFNVHSF